ncbi:hypothetical protein BGZ65_009668, partial [Modicella reniformis]
DDDWTPKDISEFCKDLQEDAQLPRLYKHQMRHRLKLNRLSPTLSIDLHKFIVEEIELYNRIRTLLTSDLTVSLQKVL